jgi:thioredoxin reductase
MRYDTIIIGGSFAGLSAALYLARARLSVCVLDTHAPRNRYAAASHGLFGQDGYEPKSMLATMRAQVAAYPSVRFLEEAAVSAVRNEAAFSVTLTSGDVVVGKKLLLAFGITDILPDLPGLAERWGRSVIHCPYCHGYEFSNQRLGVLNLSPVSIHQAGLIPEWGPTTFFLNGGTIEPDVHAGLARRGVAIEPALVERLVGEGTSLSAIRFRDGREQPLDALFIGARNRLNSDIAERLGCAIAEEALGSVVTVDEMKATSVAGVYATGDITRSAHTTTFACADGVTAAVAIHRALISEATV